ncbi:MAG: DUF5107 domain-containing protein [Schaedlerella sp.]|nr:DUF5107 domain-containing protein [Lachnospiraceae bacterium]MDY4202936.1 DUF5107 domain-containing protein [Schaedlerella sp.]
MKTLVKFETVHMPVCSLGEKCSVPDLLGTSILQNNLDFHLEEDDEIYEGYGKLTSSYPYRQYNCYQSEPKDREMKTAVLENDYIRAVFLPELGGRLWSLIDKVTGKDYVLEDLREGERSLDVLWKEMENTLFGKCLEIPERYHFISFDLRLKDGKNN